MTTPDYVVVGHVTKDLRPGGFTVGGTATYAAAAAQRLGLTAAIVTSAAGDLDPALLPPGILLHRIPSAVTTTFENTYHEGHRTQFLRAVAGPLGCADVPVAWRTAPIAHLGPLAQEVDPTLVDCFPVSIQGTTPQGWMRAWDADGRVRYTPWTSAPTVLRRADVLIFSEEDVRMDEHAINQLTGLAGLSVVTRGRRGADVCVDGKLIHFPAYVATEVDPTGAGDVFATAFLIRYQETGDWTKAAEFANAAASFVIEGPGISTLPTREQVLTRIQSGRIITTVR